MDDTEYAAIGGNFYNTYSYVDHPFNGNAKKSGALTASKDTDYLKPAES